MSILVTMLKKWSEQFAYKPDIDSIVYDVLKEFDKCKKKGSIYTEKGISGCIQYDEFLRLRADERRVVMTKVRRALFKTGKYRSVSVRENMFDYRLIMFNLVYKRK